MPVHAAADPAMAEGSDATSPCRRRSAAVVSAETPPWRTASAVSVCTGRSRSGAARATVAVPAETPPWRAKRTSRSRSPWGRRNTVASNKRSEDRRCQGTAVTDPSCSSGTGATQQRDFALVFEGFRIGMIAEWVNVITLTNQTTVRSVYEIISTAVAQDEFFCLDMYLEGQRQGADVAATVLHPVDDADRTLGHMGLTKLSSFRALRVAREDTMGSPCAAGVRQPAVEKVRIVVQHLDLFDKPARWDVTLSNNRPLQCLVQTITAAVPAGISFLLMWCYRYIPLNEQASAFELGIGNESVLQTERVDLDSDGNPVDHEVDGQMVLHGLKVFPEIAGAAITGSLAPAHAEAAASVSAKDIPPTRLYFPPLREMPGCCFVGEGAENAESCIPYLPTRKTSLSIPLDVPNFISGEGMVTSAIMSTLNTPIALLCQDSRGYVPKGTFFQLWGPVGPVDSAGLELVGSLGEDGLKFTITVVDKPKHCTSLVMEGRSSLHWLISQNTVPYCVGRGLVPTPNPEQ